MNYGPKIRVRARQRQPLNFRGRCNKNSRRSYGAAASSKSCAAEWIEPLRNRAENFIKASWKSTSIFIKRYFAMSVTGNEDCVACTS